MDKPKVGQQLFSLNVGNAARWHEQKLTPVTVMKVGRKYFWTAQDCYKDFQHMWRRYYIDSWNQTTEYSVTSVLYASEQEWEDEKEADNIIKKFKGLFCGYGRINLSLNTLRKMDELVEGKEKENGKI